MIPNISIRFEEIQSQVESPILLPVESPILLPVESPILLPVETPILTRYLYIKEDVEYSLYDSLINKRKNESLFWGYEMYFSGFVEDVFSILLFVADESTGDKNQITRFIEKKIQEFKIFEKYSIDQSNIDQLNIDKTEENYENTLQDQDIHFGTIIYNLILWLNTEFKTKKRIVVNLTSDQIKEYETFGPHNTENYKARKVLPKVCLYKSVKMSENKINIKNKWLNNWLFYASFSPVWKNRITKYGGKINIKTEKVEFLNEDQEEEFYDIYGYEPDEQKKETQNNFVEVNLF